MLIVIMQFIGKLLCYCMFCSGSIRDKRLSWPSAIAW